MSSAAVPSSAAHTQRKTTGFRHSVRALRHRNYALFWSGALLVAIGSTFSVLLHLDLTTAILLSAAVVTAYTMAGGMWSVAYTDVFQLALIPLGLLAALPFAFAHVGGAEARVVRVRRGVAVADVDPVRAVVGDHVARTDAVVAGAGPCLARQVTDPDAVLAVAARAAVEPHADAVALHDVPGAGAGRQTGRHLQAVAKASGDEVADDEHLLRIRRLLDDGRGRRRVGDPRPLSLLTRLPRLGRLLPAPLYATRLRLARQRLPHAGST